MKITEQHHKDTIETIVNETAVGDVTIFISQRQKLHRSGYKATITIVVQVEISEQIINSMAQHFDYEFEGSQVQFEENRGVDILNYSVEIGLFEDEFDK